MICRVADWKAEWRFSEFSIYAIDAESGEKQFIQTISKNGMLQKGVPINTSQLRPETKYGFSVYIDIDGVDTALDASELCGMLQYESPYKAQVFYHVEKNQESWYLIRLVVLGRIPQDGLKVKRGSHEYELPCSPATGVLYSFRMRATGGNDIIAIIPSVKMSRPVVEVDNLQELYEKVNEENQ
jgi:hypothetical protein